MKNKKISIVVPIHIYNFDPQGNLNQYQKLEMYMLAIEHMKILYKQCNIIYVLEVPTSRCVSGNI